jgi:hypothetical protein
MKLLKEGDIGNIQRLYALCPYVADEWPLPQNGVPAHCQVMGTGHATEIFISCGLGFSRDTARDIVNLAVE